MAGEMKEQQNSVPGVFKGRSIFVTGVTGFVGKVLLEKLLRSCREIKRIYVLIRPTQKGEAQHRLHDLFQQTVFDRIRLECPDMFTRVTPLSGDVTLADCGLQPSDLETVFGEVSIVFHCAASVRFDQKFKEAVLVNLEGVGNVLEMCREIDNLEGLIHVSTAYAFCQWVEIHEDVYPEKVKARDLITVCKWMGDEELHLLFKKVREGRPTAYHYTKAVAENLLHKERGSIPLCIVRPSIITAAWQEPFPGWVDTYNGPSGLIAACGKGVIKTVHACPDVTADFIPVDVVANTIIIAAWKLVLEKPAILVVNCTSSHVNPVTWGDVERLCLPLLFEYPSMELLRYPGGSFKKSSLHHKWSMVIHHLIPAVLTEVISTLTLRPLRAINMYRKIHNVLAHLEYFTTTEFDFYCPNYIMLMDEMTARDSEVFVVDIRSLNWAEYFETYVLGVRKYLLKESEDTLPEARRRMNRIYYITLAAKMAAVCGGVWALCHFLPRIPQTLSTTYDILAPKFVLAQEHMGRYLTWR